MYKLDFLNIFRKKSVLIIFVGLELCLLGILTFVLLHKENNLSNPFVTMPIVKEERKEIVKKPVKIVQKAHAQSSASFDLEKFQSYGFPAPEDPNPAAMTDDMVQRWNQYLRDPVAKASNATGVDPGIIGMWPYVETQGRFHPFDNCDMEHNASSDGDDNHNTPCRLWGDLWQVGIGVHPAYNVDSLTEAFDTMYGGHDDATVQRVGQAVIGNLNTRYGINLTIVSSFPSRSLQSIIDGAKSGDQVSRNLATTLIKDEAIGAYLVGRHFRDNVLLNSGLASKMEGWSSSYYNRQKIINYIKAVYDAR